MRLLICSFLLMALLNSCKDQTNNQNPDANTQTRDTLPASPNQTRPNDFAGIDISPMDMSYFPVDYPKLKMASKSLPAPVARIIYSRPHLGSRRLFPDILKHGEPWRLGANEATELQLFRDVTVQKKTVLAGRYNVYCIPLPGQWTIVLNSNVDTWGLKQDSTLDVHRFNIPISTGHPPVEYFTMEFSKTTSGADLVIAWDDVIGKLPIEF